MANPIAPDYGQQFLLPPALEDWVAADHPARYLREFVDELNLGEMGFEMPTCLDGRPPYAPSLLLKIWLYGYYYRIRSTRKLEAACREHLPLVWLTAMIAPDHNSLWRFWKANKKAMRAVFKKTVEVAVASGCVGLALQAVDGTRIEAAASGYSGMSRQYMEKLLAALDTALDQTELKIAEENQGQAQAECRLPAGLAERKALREQIKAGLAQLAADHREHHHPVELEARRMKVGSTNRFAYNAQVVADEQEGIIVAAEVVREENDFGQLVPMIQQAQENQGIGSLVATTVADSGYAGGTDLQAAADRQMAVLAPPAEGPAQRDHPYTAHRFRYDENAKTVTCPRGVKLDHQGQTTKEGLVVQRYRCRCQDCPVKAQCTKDSRGRQIEIWPHTPAVQRMRQRLQSPVLHQQWRRRQEIVERQFGQIKQHDGFRRWTVWGLEGVRAQWLMLCSTLNLRVLYKRWQGQRPTTAVSAALSLRVTPARGVRALISSFRPSVRLVLAFRRLLSLRPFPWPIPPVFQT